MSKLPTLSSAGWVTNPLEQIDYMLAYFFTTQKSQTHFFKGTVTSYQSLLADNDPDAGLASAIESELTDYLKTQFTDVKLDVRIEAQNPTDKTELTVVIGCTLTAGGQPYSVSHAIELLGTQVKRVFRTDETGSPT